MDLESANAEVVIKTAAKGKRFAVRNLFFMIDVPCVVSIAWNELLLKILEKKSEFKLCIVN